MATPWPLDSSASCCSTSHTKTPKSGISQTCCFLLSFTLFYFLYHGHSQPLKAQHLPIQNGAHKLLKDKQAWLPTRLVELGAFGEGRDSCSLDVLVSRLIPRMTWLVTHHAGSPGLQFSPHHFCSSSTESHQVTIIGDTEK